MHIFPFLSETAKAPSNVTQRPKVTAATLDFASVLADKATPRSLAGKGSAALSAVSATAEAAAGAAGKVRRGEDGGVLTAPGQVSLSYQDVLALRNNLEKSGISPDRLERLTQLASTPGTYSLGQVIAALRKDGPYANLDAEGLTRPALEGSQRLDARQFLQKIGMQPEEAEASLAQLDAGNTSAVWKSISSRLTQKTDGDTIDVNAAELDALAKGLKLSPGVLAAMQKLLGGQAELSATAAGLKAALVPAGQEMAAREQADRNLAQAVGSALDPVLRAAKTAANRLSQSDRREDRNAMNSMVLIREAATGKANGSDVAPALDAERRDTGANASKVRQSGLLRNLGASHDRNEPLADPATARSASAPGVVPHTRDTAQGTANASHPTTAAQPAATEKLIGDKAGDKAGDKTGSRHADQQRGGAGGDPWSELLRRIDVSPTMSGAMQMPGGEGFAQVANAAQRQTQTLPPYLSEQAAAQLERGMLGSLQDGTRQLTMRLDPVELGTVTVVLSVRNGEVNATIRPDRTETAQAISDQLHVLRTALEQQGLKVDRLEVQTQLQDNSLAQAWQDASQHNAGQEQQARSAERERFRRLRRMREGDADAAAAAQPASASAGFDGEPAHISASGLNIIA